MPERIRSSLARAIVRGIAPRATEDGVYEGPETLSPQAVRAVYNTDNGWTSYSSTYIAEDLEIASGSGDTLTVVPIDRDVNTTIWRWELSFDARGTSTGQGRVAIQQVVNPPSPKVFEAGRQKFVETNSIFFLTSYEDNAGNNVGVDFVRDYQGRTLLPNEGLRVRGNNLYDAPVDLAFRALILKSPAFNPPPSD